jgi:ribosome-associated protein
MTQNNYKKDGSAERPEVISKTARKKEMTELQDMGEILTELSKERLAQVPMSEELREAVKEFKRLSANGARRRQMQYIGKLMRHEEIEPIQAKIDQFQGVSTVATALLHRIERIRNDMVANDEAITKFLNEFPEADVQLLRNLVRNTRKETELAKPPKSYRELFQAIKAILDARNVAPDVI